ncbi:Mth938-like domain-containing protein [Rhodobacteraceae bacterium M382]|nr:Mth938-like domain-containing protein [Rhodobacteraceae bacterium M382]
MQLSEVGFGDVKPVDGYGDGFFRVGGVVFQGAILTSVKGTASWGGYQDSAPLVALAKEFDVLLVGTGPEIAHIPADLRRTLEQAGLGVEVMNSPAACRTYNVLLSEGRRVALAALTV